MAAEATKPVAVELGMTAQAMSMTSGSDAAVEMELSGSRTAEAAAAVAGSCSPDKGSSGTPGRIRGGSLSNRRRSRGDGRLRVLLIRLALMG